MQVLNLSKEESLKMLDLRKEQVNLLCLEKKPLQNLTSRVGVVLDYSGSMSTRYRNGTVQSILERLFPLALQFDDNGEMELWIFDTDFKRLNNITKDNYYGYIDREILSKYDMGGTRYAPVLKDVYNKYMIEDVAKLPNFLIFITDGDNSDKENTTEVIRKISEYPIFIQFIGVGNDSMQYLEELDNLDKRYVDNANFFRVSNINEMTDNELYNKLLSEYPAWLEYPEVKKMITSQGEIPPNPIFGGVARPEKKGFFARLISS